MRAKSTIRACISPRLKSFGYLPAKVQRVYENLISFPKRTTVHLRLITDNKLICLSYFQCAILKKGFFYEHTLPTDQVFMQNCSRFNTRNKLFYLTLSFQARSSQLCSTQLSKLNIHLLTHIWELQAFGASPIVMLYMQKQLT